MKTSAKLFLYLGLFYVPLIFIYGHFTEWSEPVGAVGLALSAGFGLMIAGYFTMTDRKMDLDPSDKPEGEINEVSGEVGFFSPYSWWPLWLAASISLLALGLAVGWWIVFVAAPLVALAVVGWVFEYFSGEHAI
ncbi:cytochrome c oxidase subunit 4 [Dermacoccus barathri]|uniref:cytochrome c oxidase subunit 4 n=1 Tax=Dermacoccus barathri TaxID=322601 RepID=UPI00187A5A97|nr:cytochrome c oxidase subunit 4 [Dermacoccus barathri]MBE7371883.1 cytochrome c oxidase subunit 4 [Dermacoccus barathri]